MTILCSLSKKGYGSLKELSEVDSSLVLAALSYEDFSSKYEEEVTRRASESSGSGL